MSKGFASDCIQDHVDIFDHILEFRLRVINRLIGPKFFEEVLIRRGSRRDDPRATCLGDLNRQVADSAGAAVDENGLALTQFCGIDQGLPCGRTAAGTALACS